MDFDLIIPTISQQENMKLIKDVNYNEVKNAVFDLAPNKTPGPDGFPPYFFQK